MDTSNDLDYLEVNIKRAASDKFTTTARARRAMMHNSTAGARFSLKSHFLLLAIDSSPIG